MVAFLGQNEHQDLILLWVQVPTGLEQGPLGCLPRAL